MRYDVKENSKKLNRNLLLLESLCLLDEPPNCEDDDDSLFFQPSNSSSDYYSEDNDDSIQSSFSDRNSLSSNCIGFFDFVQEDVLSGPTDYASPKEINYLSFNYKEYLISEIGPKWIHCKKQIIKENKKRRAKGKKNSKRRFAERKVYC